MLVLFHGDGSFLSLTYILVWKQENQLGDNCIKSFHLGKYIVRYKNVYGQKFSFTATR